MHISFKKVKVEDCDFILKIRNDDSTRAFLHNSSTFSKDEFKSWFCSKKPDWLKVIANEKEVGYIRTVIDYPDIEIGMDISPDHRGKGYAKAAYKKLLKNLKYKCYRKATLRVLKANDRAFNLYKKLGFKTIEETENDFYMEFPLNKFTGKAAKVICTWYGGRRGSFGGEGWNPEHNLEMFEYWWSKEKNIDYGYPSDILIVNNVFNASSPCSNFINSLHGKNTVNGKVKVFERENIGASFGAFDFAFNKFKNEYDYWFFLEDDYIILKDGILKDAINRITELSSTIGYYGVVGCQDSHCNGACGITSRSILQAVEDLNFSSSLNRNSLPFLCKEGVDFSHETHGEIPFTKLIKKNLKLNFYCPKIKNMILSWKQNKKRGIDFPERIVTHDERFKI